MKDIYGTYESYFAPGTPEGTAKAIVEGTTMRKREIYFPGYARYFVMFRDIATWLSPVENMITGDS